METKKKTKKNGKRIANVSTRSTPPPLTSDKQKKEREREGEEGERRGKEVEFFFFFACQLVF